METQWTDRRKGYRYKGFFFSEDGKKAKDYVAEYREVPFPPSARKHFNLWLAVVMLFTFPGIPLLAYSGLNKNVLWAVATVLSIAYWLYGRIHACPICGRKSRILKTPHMGAPVLYLCTRCRTFFEHGQIDGGWPWK